MTSFVDEVFSFDGRIITENLVIEFCSFELGNVLLQYLRVSPNKSALRQTTLSNTSLTID